MPGAVNIIATPRVDRFRENQQLALPGQIFPVSMILMEQ